MLLKNKKRQRKHIVYLQITLRGWSYSSVVKTLITLAKDPGSIPVPMGWLTDIHNSSFSRSDSLFWLSSQQEDMCHTCMHVGKPSIHIRENK